MVSIVIPNYNNEKYIEHTIKSILNQSYKNYELIVVDDKSIDLRVESLFSLEIYLNQFFFTTHD